MLFGTNIDGAGGLIGFTNREHDNIINSYATGDVDGLASLGGLIGAHLEGKISNSYATGNVTGFNQWVGGFVGDSGAPAIISNSYATGSVAGANRVGGFAGEAIGVAEISYSYATGSVSGSGANVGGLIGSGDSNTVRASYWDSDTSGLNISAAGSSQTTVELQSPTEDAGIYSQWSETNWDFGTSKQYPRLKYAQNSVGNACDGAGLPVCGSPISPKRRFDIKEFRLSRGEIIPPLILDGRINYRGSKIIGVDPGETIHLIVRSDDAAARFRVLRVVGSDETQAGAEFGTDGSSREMTLSAGVNHIVVEITFSDPSLKKRRYNFYLDYPAQITEIDYLEDLDAIRKNLSGNYRLTRDLDFLDDASYRTISNKDRWTADFGDTRDSGWSAIGDATTPFTGLFDGNGFVISNLQIKRTTNGQGLFEEIGGAGIVRDLGLAKVKIQGERNLGALVSINRGTVIGSYATGTVEGIANVGGLVGLHYTGSIINSHAAVDIVGRGIDGSTAESAAGGLVGMANHYGPFSPKIINSYATGTVMGRNNSGGLVGAHLAGQIFNGYATGNVIIIPGVGNRRIGGFVGFKGANAEISDSYATGSVVGGNASGIGGFAGSASGGGEISNSYSIGNVSGSGTNLGGLIGIGALNTARGSYWNSDTGGITLSAAGTSTDTVALQSPTDASGIYSGWSEDSWYFGTNNEYPTLRYAMGPNGDGVRH